MDKITPETVADWFGLALVVGAFAWAGIQWLASKLRRDDAEWAARNPAVPDQQSIAAAHVEKVQRKRNFRQQHYYRYADGVETEGGCHD